VVDPDRSLLDVLRNDLCLRASHFGAGWRTRRAPASEGRGQGIGFARYKNTGAYCAVVADVTIEERVRVQRLHITVDVGLAINPDGEASIFASADYAVIGDLH
jgi:CO/xanthine dehydrogenase Mo-binding subunit